MKLDEERSRRLKFLADNLSIDYEGDEGAAAMLNAVDNVLGDAFKYLKSTLEDAQAADGLGKGAALLLEILQRDFAELDETQSKELIISSFSKLFGYYESGAFLSELNKYAESVSITYSQGAVKIECSAVSSLDALIRFCKAVSDFVPPFLPCTASGSGASFSEWDRLSASWYQLEKMDMPFYFIETFNIQE